MQTKYWIFLGLSHILFFTNIQTPLGFQTNYCDIDKHFCFVSYSHFRIDRGLNRDAKKKNNIKKIEQTRYLNSALHGASNKGTLHGAFQPEKLVHIITAV